MIWEIFFKKNHTQNVVENLLPDTFLWINSLMLHIVSFYCMPSWGLSKCIKTQMQTTCFCILKSIWTSLELKSLPHFLHDLWRKYLSYSIKWPNFIFGCLYFVRHRAICLLKLFVNQVATSQILKLTISF